VRIEKKEAILKAICFEKRRDMKIKKLFRKMCNDCYRMYNPEGKYQKFCPECAEKRYIAGYTNKKKTKNLNTCV
jgi:hypothetical protein